MDRFKPGDIIQDKYKVTGRLGEGGMAFVLAAYQTNLERPVALKFLLPKILAKPPLVERFAREAIAGSKIKSEHVAAIYDVDKVDGVPFIVMELLEGKTLADVLAGNPSLPVAAIVDFILEAAEGISAAHALGIIHRDLKPENLFVAEAPDRTSSVKVLDFGISKSTLHKGAALTSTSDVMGTPAYMSPEQLKASHDVDARSDVWALAVILYEALCRTRPFAGSSFMEVYASIVGTMYKPASHHRDDVPPELDGIFDETFTLDRADRIPSIQAFAARLARFGTEKGRASSERIRRLASGSSAPPRDAQVLGVTAPGIKEVVREDPPREATKTTVDPPRSRRFVPLAGFAALVAVGGFLGVTRVMEARVPAAPSTAAALVPVPPVGAVPSTSPAASASAEVSPEVEAPAPSASAPVPETVPIVASAPKDPARAATLYRELCDHGRYAACGRLATLYREGRGVARDTSQAVSLYGVACSGGDGPSCMSAGGMYFGGDGVAKNEEMGVRYFRSACTKGEPAGCVKASVAFALGQGVEKDASQAFSYAKLACNGGAAEGCMRVADAKLTGAGVTKDVAAGLAQLDGLCTGGTGAACGELAGLYDRGLGADLPADADRARRYAEKGCRVKDPTSCQLTQRLRSSFAGGEVPRP